MAQPFILFLHNINPTPQRYTYLIQDVYTYIILPILNLTYIGMIKTCFFRKLP